MFRAFLTLCLVLLSGYPTSAQEKVTTESGKQILLSADGTWTTVETPKADLKVKRVVDGDTIEVTGVGIVRLIGVDTPETVHPSKPIEYFGKEASAFTRRMAEGASVRLEYDQQRIDKYNRTLAYVFLSDGRFLNAEIVKQGFGHAYTVYPFKYMEDFRGYEREARENSRGLWAQGVVEVGKAPKGKTRAAAGSVFVTKSGKKYHRDGCNYLSKSKIPIALADAQTRYQPCSVCDPPTGDIQGQSKPAPSRQVDVPQKTSSGRCEAITKKGTQCSRQAKAGSSYCWQHGG